MILVQILLNASMNGFVELSTQYRRKIFDLWKNGAIKYITHLDKFSYFPKHYNFHEITLYSQYPSKNFKSKFVFSQTT